MTTIRQIADLYSKNEWPAVVTGTDRRTRALGLIVDVNDETLTVRREHALDAVFRHGDVLEIYPYHPDRD